MELSQRRQSDETGESAVLVGDSEGKASMATWQIAIAIIIPVVFISAVATAIVLTTRPNPDKGTSNHHGTSGYFSMEDYFSGNFYAKGVSYKWVLEANAYTQIETDDDGNTVLMWHSTDNPGEATVLCDDSGLVANSSSYYVSPAGDYVMFALDFEQVYRHSYLANYYVYDVATKTTTPLTDTGTSIDDMVRYATFAPVGTAVAFVRDNDIFLTDVSGGPDTQITFTGVRNALINGVPDWVYEEELYSSNFALWFAPDASAVAYCTFNESAVPEYEFDEFYGYGYPSKYRYKYPLPGFPNSVVTLSIYNITTGVTTPIDTAVFGTDQYLTQVMWADNTHLTAKVSNRLQNEQHTLLVDSTSAAVTTINIETADEYIEQESSMQFVSTTQYIDLRVDGDRMHIALFDTTDPLGPPTFLTSSQEWEVSYIVGFRPDTSTVYFVSTEPSPLERHLYSVTLAGTDKTRLTKGTGYYSANMSPTANHIVLHYSGPDVPTYKLFATASPADPPSKFTELITMEDNKALADAVSKLTLPKKTFTTVKGAHPLSKSLNAMVLTPPHTTGEALPVLMHVYGGPGSQLVTVRFELDWHSVLCSMGYIVVTVDNIGTGGRGEAFLKATYKQLGVLEVADQIAAAKDIQKWPNVDSKRIGLWGWSYGGFMASSVIAEGGAVIKMTMAVAPVTDWRFYDSIYTERYMALPTEESNLDGYIETSVVEKAAAGDFGGNFLLVHGLADDNVHFQNSAMLVSGLVSDLYPFRTMYYPNKAHSLSGLETREHLYNLLTEFVEAHL